ncbi:MAG: hypothetical protein ACI9J3_001227 [Parvicellaceae bacterium]|jgi:hypothetical protein
MKKSILTIGLGVLLCSVGFSQSQTTETTETNSQATTLQPREVKIKNSVIVPKPTSSVSIKSNAVKKAEAVDPKKESGTNKTEK